MGRPRVGKAIEADRVGGGVLGGEGGWNGEGPFWGVMKLF